MAGLVSADKTLEVRTARGFHRCYGADKWWRSPSCGGSIHRGEQYVAKVEIGLVAGKLRWIRDKRHYCEHCSLVALGSVKVGEVAA